METKQPVIMTQIMEAKKNGNLVRVTLASAYETIGNIIDIVDNRICFDVQNGKQIKFWIYGISEIEILDKEKTK